MSCAVYIDDYGTLDFHNPRRHGSRSGNAQHILNTIHSIDIIIVGLDFELSKHVPLAPSGIFLGANTDLSHAHDTQRSRVVYTPKAGRMHGIIAELDCSAQAGLPPVLWLLLLASSRLLPAPSLLV